MEFNENLLSVSRVFTSIQPEGYRVLVSRCTAGMQRDLGDHKPTYIIRLYLVLNRIINFILSFRDLWLRSIMFWGLGAL